MADKAWSLSNEQRAETVSRVGQNIESLAFSRGIEINDAEAHSIATTVEKKAYTTASVEATTTTGFRPHDEVLKSYARKLAELVLDKVKASGGKAEKAEGTNDSSELDLAGDREFLTAESASEALAPLLAEGSTITKIKLSTKSFGRDAAETAAKAIANVAASLEHADLSDIIAGRPEAEALEAMRIISGALAQVQLRSLNLSDNALGEKGVRAFAAAISDQACLTPFTNCSARRKAFVAVLSSRGLAADPCCLAGLQRLAFQNVGCSIHACQAVAELVQHSGDLRALHLYNNMSDDEGAIAIAQILSRAPVMEDFRMASSRVGAEGGIALAQGLSAGSSLLKLDLSDNPMTAEVAPALAEAVRGQESLQLLNLNDVALGDEGIEGIAEALPANLVELHLALNEVTPEGASALAASLGRLGRLQVLGLRENELENDGAAAIAAAIGRLGAVALAKAVASSGAKLERLDLDDNQISEGGIDQIKEILERAGLSHALSLEDNDPDADEDGDEGDEEGIALYWSVMTLYLSMRVTFMAQMTSMTIHLGSHGRNPVCLDFQQRGGRRCLSVVNMKKDIHPQYFEESKVFCNGEEVMTVSGTKEKYVVDVWSGNHPFFQGTQEALILDEGRVNKFNKRFATLGAYGKVAPSAVGGDKKLEYKGGKDKGKKGKGKR
ncbi:RNI-like protein [Coccomyxa subellipsoidea C-169]|uniref:Large ribosomal subunit protein bL31c n=1 Tax=Coccomyxa subellipsoidea (strain C-169) TaxID=574566 RepID=I0YJJ2_COCSC|nr:RNI-like protein [Coccomyxa subellipsoidea C-169]EIE18561.1 RNI-like protein [Coccomyxa subellipsoidea C-169]|eukprot:XP_005643105.1 RNI-like protein [Coccomyxa subellipsoidea C-169]